MPKAKPVDKWRDCNTTARDLVSDSNVVAAFNCVGCRRWVEFNAWKIGAVLADDPIQRLRFNCAVCGVCPKDIEVSRRTSRTPERLLTITLNPACFDDQHRAQQARALAKAEARWAKVQQSQRDENSTSNT